MTITEKVAYIQGVFEGLGLNERPSAEARIISELLGVVKEMSQRLEQVSASVDGFEEELDILSGDVCALESAVYDDDDLDDEDGDFFEIPCPACGRDLVVDDEALEAGVVDCPACGGRFALSFEDEERDEDAEEAPAGHEGDVVPFPQNEE